jgi:ABC-2 type transport system permease protein
MRRTADPRTRNRAFVDAVRAEASKLYSLPASWLILGGTLALTVVLSVALGSSAGDGALDRSGASILDYGVTAVTWTQFGFFLVGVIASSSEYIGGQVRTTLVAIPDRIRWRLAATLALVPLAFAAGLIVVLASLSTMLVATGFPVGEVDPGTAVRIVFSAAAYLALMAALGSALGLLIRRAIPAAAILLLYLLVVSPLLQSQNWYFLPDIASYTLWFASVPDAAPPAIVAWLVVIAWTLAFLLPSMITAQRRDM